MPGFGQQMEENVAQQATDRETQQKSEFRALFCSLIVKENCEKNKIQG